MDLAVSGAPDALKIPTPSEQNIETYRMRCAELAGTDPEAANHHEEEAAVHDLSLEVVAVSSCDQPTTAITSGDDEDHSPLQQVLEQELNRVVEGTSQIGVLDRESFAAEQVFEPVQISNDSLSASELRERAAEVQDLSDENLNVLAYTTRNVMPHNGAEWAWGKSTWALSAQKGVVSHSSFIPYSEHTIAEIEERFSAWKSDVAPPTFKIKVGSRGLTHTIGKRFGMGADRSVTLNFETMTELDESEQRRRPIQRREVR